LFNEEEENKLLLSQIKVDPSISPFIKSRFEVIDTAETYSELLEKVKRANIHVDGFKAEYLVLDGDATPYVERLEKLKDIGYCIEGDPDYVNPTVIYSISYYNKLWYFGILVKHDSSWFKHKNKPRSFSSAINMDIAKALVSIASKGNKSNRLLDAGCGVGTVMLEACIAGFDIEGCDIHWKACVATRENLAHYNYNANVIRTDIKDLDKTYDTAIVDLPYNLYTHSNDASVLHIIESTAQVARRLVIVSTADIAPLLKEAQLAINDFCLVGKKGKNFSRSIWVCEKESASVELV
jgi:tRNA G10  N-methylase Trm11